MTYKEFCESQDIQYQLKALLNGEEVGEIAADSVAELELHELDTQVNAKLTEIFDALPESQADAQAANDEDRLQQE